MMPTMENLRTRNLFPLFHSSFLNKFMATVLILTNIFNNKYLIECSQTMVHFALHKQPQILLRWNLSGCGIFLERNTNHNNKNFRIKKKKRKIA